MLALRPALARHPALAPHPPRLRLRLLRFMRQGGTIRARRASHSETVAVYALAWMSPGGMCMWQDGRDAGGGVGLCIRTRIRTGRTELGGVKRRPMPDAPLLAVCGLDAFYCDFQALFGVGRSTLVRS